MAVVPVLVERFFELGARARQTVPEEQAVIGAASQILRTVQTNERRLSLKSLALLVLAGAVLLGTENRDKVRGFGGFPNSSDLTSMWLTGADGRPVIMAYFHGPKGWHQTKWTTAGEFEPNGTGWAEFHAEAVTLRLWLNPNTGDTEVQSEKFNAANSNVFLVVDVGGKGQRVIPLGIFPMPASADEPPSALLLRTTPELVERMQKEILGAGASRADRPEIY